MSDVLDRSVPGVLLRLIPFEGAEDERVRIDLGDRLINFEYLDAEKGHDKIKLTLRNNDLAFFEDDHGLLGGGRLEVSWGYRELMSRPRDVVMKKAKGFLTLQLEGYDGGVLLDQLQRSWWYENVTRSDVAAQIAERHGFSSERQFIQDTPERFEGISQAGETDSELLRRLADREAFSWWIDPDGFHFKERDQSQAPIRVFTYYPGDEGAGDVISVDMESDLTKRVSSVRSKSIDPETGQENEFVATTDSVPLDALAIAQQGLASAGVVRRLVDPETGDLNLTIVRPDGTKESVSEQEAASFEQRKSIIDQAIVDRNATESVVAEGMTTKSENQRLAGARYKRAERKTVKLRVTVVGDPRFAAKTVVEMRGIGSWLSGLYFVEEAKHSVKPGSYIVVLKLSADGVHKILGGTTGKGAGADVNDQEGAFIPPDPFIPKPLTRVRVIDPETGAESFKYVEV